MVEISAFANVRGPFPQRHLRLDPVALLQHLRQDREVRPQPAAHNQLLVKEATQQVHLMLTKVIAAP